MTCNVVNHPEPRSPACNGLRRGMYFPYRIDEVGYLSYDSKAADLLFEVVNRRYKAQKSVALTTNLAFKNWTTVFPNATCTVALVDRLCHRADILKVEGDSWRKKEAMERQERRKDDEENDQ
ncbi:hypothetical protein FIV42_15975 [Persicimonas caeni]|uniref:IstB-like ATP-binding domain-containing protein n=2 Tax=Persicimonas caeni TaxID=2292766 RepID=A0A4Y6PVA9_PERCE|nr:hypothetical protein FIV42_15975 [Persicimonas caeni]QED33405.1 hypothetical protein FRD00_15970 [Persicimonas caeni]